MIPPGKISIVTAQMGQKSSQPKVSGAVAQVEEENIETEKRKHQRSHGKKGKRRKKTFPADAMQEETAHILSKLSGDTVVNNGHSSSDDDDPAALQLQVESLPRMVGASSGTEGHTSRQSDEADGDIQVHGGRNKKRKRHAPQTFPGEEGTSPDVDEYRRSKHARLPTHSISPVSVQIIDDINTEDEAIAAYLRDYEEEQTVTPFSPFSEDVEPPSKMEKIAAEVARDDSPVILRSTQELPSYDNRSPRRTKKYQQMREKEGSGSELNGEGANTPGSSNGTGQHAFDEDAFGDYLTNLLNSANTYHQAPSHDIPLDPRLTESGHDPTPGAEPSFAEMDLDFTETSAINRKLSNIYSSRMHRSILEQSDADIYAPPRSDSSEMGYDDQEQIMPGIEAGRSQASDTGSLVVDSNRPASSRSSCEVVMVREKTPPPLAKRSKPRGNKSQQGGRKTKNHNPPLTQIAQRGGMFTQIEMTKLDTFRDAYCEENGINTWKFNDLIHAAVRGNDDAPRLWSGIHDLFPYRTRMSVSRFCRRRFHNFSARGVWTQSEDEMLKRAVAEKGNSWKAVGALIDRFPEDCRDRYRNYHVNAAYRNRETWTDAEVKNLCWAVYDCMSSKREEKRRAKQEEYGRDIPESEPDSDQEVEEMKLINWQAVSDRMGESGGARSRLQCSFKWGKLKNVERDTYMREVKALMKASKKLERRKARKNKGPWRMRRATKKLENMKSGDRYDFLQALSACDVDDAKNVPWKLLGDAHFRATWTVTDRKAAWENFKKEVPASDTMDYHVVVDRLLAKLLEEDGDRLHERWDPSVDGDISKGVKQRRKKKDKEKTQVSRYKSKAIVESDDENEYQNEQHNSSVADEAGKPEADVDQISEEIEDRGRPNEVVGDRDAEQSSPGGQQSGAEEDESDDSLFNSKSDDDNDAGLIVH